MMPIIYHTKMSPSRLPRILACPGSFQLIQQLELSGKIQQEHIESSYAVEGTMLHMAFEQHIFNHPDSWALTPVNHSDLTVDQLSAVQDCIDYVASVAKRRLDFSMSVEKRVYLKELDPILYEVEGTCDIILEAANEIHIMDEKYGQGVWVDAKDNAQLLAYLLGAIQLKQNLNSDKRYFIHVLQPRMNNFQMVEYTADELIGWLNKLTRGVQTAYSKNAPMTPGESQCRFCEASVLCTARYERVQEIAQDVFKAHKKVATVSNRQLADLLKRAKEFERYVQDVRLYIFNELRLGRPFPGFKLVVGRSTRKWKDQRVAEQFLGRHLELDKIYESKMVSPAKAEKLLSKSARAELVTYIEKPKGKPVLAFEEDRRPELKVQKAEQVFQNCKSK